MIWMMGGAMPNDGPMIATIEQEFLTCPHCQRTIRWTLDMTSPVGRRLETDYACKACNSRPICVPCGELMHAGRACPGPYAIRTNKGLT